MWVVGDFHCLGVLASETAVEAVVGRDVGGLWIVAGGLWLAGCCFVEPVEEVAFGVVEVVVGFSVAVLAAMLDEAGEHGSELVGGEAVVLTY